MTFKRWLPILVLVGMAVAAYALGLHKYLTLDALRDNRAALSAYVSAHTVTAALAYITLYMVVVALSLPAGVVLTLSGGLLFGGLLGAALTVVGATLGATALFLIARSAFGDTLRARAGPFLAKMADGFAKDAFNYLLFLRLVPAFPFWAVNLAPALLGMKLVPYVVATGIGIIPGTTIFSLFGAGLGAVFERGEAVSLKSVLNPTLVAAMVGMGLLSLLPIALRRWRERAQ